jgi:hypothetical protein
MHAFELSAAQIANALRSPLPNVEKHWPSLRLALSNQGIKFDSGVVAALATIGAEVRRFEPINEYGGDSYFKRMYDPEGARPKVAAALGNINPGDGVKFHGRGFIQLTGRANYAFMSKRLKINLLANPELANKEPHASAIFAEYLKGHGVDVWAQKAWTAKAAKCAFCENNGLKAIKIGESTKMVVPFVTDPMCSDCAWKTSRRKVNGGLNGYKEYKSAIDQLRKILDAHRI